MGTWDIGFFDNNMACDWENDITVNTDIKYIENTLKEACNNSEDELDIDIANRALAAADALARLLGSPGEENSYTENLELWVKSYKKEIPLELKKLALQAIDNVLSPESELKQYWKIRPENDDWLQLTQKLKDRLK